MWLEFHTSNSNFYPSKKIDKGLKNVTVMKSIKRTLGVEVDTLVWWE